MMIWRTGKPSIRSFPVLQQLMLLDAPFVIVENRAIIFLATHLRQTGTLPGDVRRVYCRRDANSYDQRRTRHFRCAGLHA